LLFTLLNWQAGIIESTATHDSAQVIAAVAVCVCSKQDLAGPHL